MSRGTVVEFVVRKDSWSFVLVKINIYVTTVHALALQGQVTSEFYDTK